MELPADDNGPEFEAAPPKKKAKVPKKAARTSKAAKVPKKGSSLGPDAAASSSGLQLPSDDEEGFEVRPSAVEPVAAKKPSLSPQLCLSMQSGLPCDHATLKEAAASIASVVDMPYADILQVVASAQPTPMKCTLWEIYSVARLGPVIREQGGTCRRSYDIRHFWDFGEEA